MMECYWQGKPHVGGEKHIAEPLYPSQTHTNLPKLGPCCATPATKPLNLATIHPPTPSSA